MKKKLEVVELNKVEEKIILEEEVSPLILFIRKNGGWLLLILFVILAIPVSLLIRNLDLSNKNDIELVSVVVEPSELGGLLVDANRPLTDESAQNQFSNNDLFKGKGEILIVKTVETDSFIIKYFSDGTALKRMKQNNFSTRVGPLDDGSYGITDDGTILSGAKYTDLTVSNRKSFPWGNVLYYSDGSAEVIDSKFDIFVRDGSEIKENYISSNKVSYLKESKNYGNKVINYYYDGTMEIIDGKNKTVVRNPEDIKINGNNISYPNNNQGRIIKTVTYDTDNKDKKYTVDYYSDGSAIIYDGSRTISVRKSNSIIIKDNKIVEIVDNIYVEVTDTKKNGDIIYYSNGSAVINYKGKKYYVDENSNIKYSDNDNISKVDGTKEEISSDRKIKDTHIQIFEETAVIETSEYIAIVPKDKVVYDTDGSLKEILETTDMDNLNKFSITNNSDDEVKYRIVIEQSDRTNFSAKYIKYRLKANDLLIDNKYLSDNLWKEDSLKSALSSEGINYILIDDVIKPHSAVNIRLLIWADYERMNNDMQDKYFYGTLRIYSWKEK